MNGWLIRLGICCAYYTMGGLATTNMLRLLKGASTSVLDSCCYCDSCGSKIRVWDQLPIFSYIWNRGECRYCKNRIPIGPLFLEIAVFLGMSILSAIFQFSLAGIMVSFLYYEILKWMMILFCGRREKHFGMQYFFSLVGLLFPLLMVLFMAMLLYVV